MGTHKEMLRYRANHAEIEFSNAGKQPAAKANGPNIANIIRKKY